MKAGIVGAGIMGRLLAFELVNSGWQVDMFDQQDPAHEDSCSQSAAGLLTPMTELTQSNRLLMQLGLESLNKLWPKIINLLNDEIYFERKGTLLVAHEKNRDELINFIRLTEQKISDKKSYQRLSKIDIKILEPELDKFSEGYFFADEGQIDSQTLMGSLAKYLKRKIRWHIKTKVDLLRPNEIIIANDQAYYFNMVFDCRGVGAKSCFNDLRGVRGELIWVHAPEVNLHRPIRLLSPRFNWYLAPRPDHIYIIGATEIESEYRKAISVRSTLELLSAAYYLHSGFAEAEVIKTIENCRPTLADSMPKIKYQDGLLQLNGLYRHGFSLAPILVNEVMLWLKARIVGVNYPQLWELCTEEC